MDPIQAAIKQAQDAAAALAAAQAAAGPSTAVATQQAGAVATTQQAPVKLSMESMSIGQMSVDQWLKVNEDGIKIGDNQGLIESLELELDMTENRGFVLKFSAKAGNPAQYVSTYDMVNANTGGSWEQALARLQALSPGIPVRPYRAVDLPFRVPADIKLKDKVVARAGEVLGYSTATTNWNNWETFHRAVVEAGLKNKVVRVKLTAEPKKNKAGNVWGVFKFELLGEATQEEEAD